MRSFLAIVFSLAAVTAPAATRVALVSTCGGEAGQNVLALAEVELGAMPDVVLVERREVERVLTEQKLMHCALSEAAQAVAAGKLLGVEVFASLETIPKEKEALGLVVFDAGTGIKLWDAALPAGGAKAMAGGVASAVRAACEKRQGGGAGLIPVCVLAVRNADLPRDLDSFCDSLGLLLERRLLDSPTLAVLERRHLEHVNRERSLPVSAPAGDLFPSLVVMDLELSRGQNTNDIKAVALLSDGNARLIGKASATVGGRDLKELSEHLLDQITKTLNLTPAAKRGDPTREAQRFLSEARFLRDQGESARALQWFEAAAALDPKDVGIESDLASALGSRAQDLMHSERLPEAIDVALRSVHLARDTRLKSLATNGRVEVDGPEQPLCDDGFWITALNRVRGADSATKDQLFELQRQLRTLLLETVLKHSREPKPDLRAYWDYTGFVSELLRRMEAFSASSEEWSTGSVEAVRHWLKLAEEHRLSRNWSLYGVRMMARLCLQAKGPFRVLIPHRNDWQLQEPDHARLRLLFQEMEQHRDPVVRAYGAIGQLAGDLRGTKGLSDNARQRCAAIRETIRQEIRKPTREPAETTRSNAYGVALDLIDLMLDDPAERRREYLDLFQFMLEQKHCAYWSIVMVTDPEAHTFRHFFAPISGGLYGGKRDVFPVVAAGWTREDCVALARNLESAKTLERSGECVEVDCGLWSFKSGSPPQDFAEIGKKLSTIHPDLAPKPVPPPWSAAKLVFDVSQRRGLRSISLPCVEKNAVWVGAVGDDGSLSALQIPIEGGDPRVAQTVASDVHQITCAVLYERALYVGTDGAGVFIAPFDGTRMERITRENGLPSDSAQALACAEGKLFAALDDGYLVACDLKTKSCRVLASSRRKEKKSLLDDLTPPLQVRGMLADAARHRILFLADFERAECFPLLGLWQIDVRSGELSQLLQFDRAPAWMQRHGPDRVLIHFWRFQDMIYTKVRGACSAPAVGAVNFDLAANSGQLVYAWSVKGHPANAVGPKLPGGEKVTVIPLQSSWPLLLVDGWLWFRDGNHNRSGRISPDGQTVESFPAPDGSGSPPNWDSLQRIGDGRRVLAGDSRRMWLLTLPKK